MSVTHTEIPSVIEGRPAVRRHVFDWTSASDGSAVSDPVHVEGTILRVIFVPDPTDAPTDNYDITLTDEYGIDVLAGQGANLDTANESHVCPGLTCNDGTNQGAVPITVAGPLTLNVANAGSVKSGQVILLVQ